MGFELRLPNINGKTDREQLAQIKGYLYQIIPQLQWALNNASPSAGNVVVQQPTTAKAAAPSEADVAADFNAIKSLIIKSADIVNAYYAEISRRLDGEYVARSDFGTYSERTSQEITENSTGVERLFTNVQKISSDVDGLAFTLVEVNDHIRTGLLDNGDDGVPVYGLEIGQRNTVDGVEVFNKYARFTSDRLSFFDHNDTEVAYISDYKLYITHVEITGTAKFGAFLLDTTAGFRLKYAGRG